MQLTYGVPGVVIVNLDNLVFHIYFPIPFHAVNIKVLRERQFPSQVELLPRNCDT